MAPMDPVAITASPSSSGATVVWRHRGRLSVTLIMKATFALARGVTTPLPPEAIVRVERSDRGHVVPDDLAPFLARADIWVAALARAPFVGPRNVRISVLRGATKLLDKSASVSAEQLDAPLTLFSPLSRRWPVRAGLLNNILPTKLEGNAIAVPDEVDWRYFQAAPTDQQIPYLDGTELILLENLVVGEARFETRLPPLSAEASLHEPGRPPVPLKMVLDTLAVDPSRRVCHVIFRGSAALHGALNEARIEQRFRTETPSLKPSNPDFEGTMDLSKVDLASLTMAKPGPTPVPFDDVPVGATMSIDARAIAAIREKYATPFERSQKPGAQPEVTAPPPSSRAAPSAKFGETVAGPSEEIAALRAKYATPFDQARERRSSPPSVAPAPLPPAPPLRSSVVPASVSVEIQPPRMMAKPSAEPVIAKPVSTPPSNAPREIPAAPVLGPPIAKPGETPFSSTAVFADSEVAALRAQFATPFENPFAKRDRPPPKPVALVVEAEKRSLGDTAATDADEVRALRKQYAAPFEARMRKNPVEPKEAPVGPKRVGTLGACFLAALVDHGVNGLFDNDDVTGQ